MALNDGTDAPQVHPLGLCQRRVAVYLDSAVRVGWHAAVVVSDALLRHLHVPTAFMVGERVALSPMATKGMGPSDAETGRNGGDAAG
jgi:hypothetical protein